MARYTRRYVIRLKLKGRQIYFYYCGRDLGWGNIEYAIQFLGEPLARSHMHDLVAAYNLDEAGHFEEISTVLLNKELEDESLFFESRIDNNISAIVARINTNAIKQQKEKQKEVEEKTYEIKKKYQKGKRYSVHCTTCKCFSCKKSPVEGFQCRNCLECIAGKTRYEKWDANRLCKYYQSRDKSILDSSKKWRKEKRL